MLDNEVIQLKVLSSLIAGFPLCSVFSICGDQVASESTQVEILIYSQLVSDRVVSVV